MKRSVTVVLCWTWVRNKASFHHTKMVTKTLIFSVRVLCFHNSISFCLNQIEVAIILGGWVGEWILASSLEYTSYDALCAA